MGDSGWGSLAQFEGGRCCPLSDGGLTPCSGPTGGP